jgi:hypothetical protein
MEQRAAIVDLLRDHFVGVVLDNYIADGYGKKGHHCPEDADWYKQAGIGSNTWSFVAASGRPLGTLGHTNPVKALEAFKQLPESDRMPKVQDEPDPEKGIANLRPPVGGLVARLYSTPLERTPEGEWARAAKVYTDCYASSGGCVEPGLTQLDMLWMTAAEWRSLVPATAKPGDSFRIPAVLERRMISESVPCANPVGDVGELTLTVQAASAEGTTVRLEGWSRQGVSFHESKAAYRKPGPDGKGGKFAPVGQATRWLGTIRYDARKDALTAFDILAIGNAWGEYVNRKYGAGRGAEPQRWPAGYAFEIAGSCSADRITPPKMVQNGLYNGGLTERYWGSK